jgi:hypothetical protein
MSSKRKIEAASQKSFAKTPSGIPSTICQGDCSYTRFLNKGRIKKWGGAGVISGVLRQPLSENCVNLFFKVTRIRSNVDEE